MASRGWLVLAVLMFVRIRSLLFTVIGVNITDIGDNLTVLCFYDEFRPTRVVLFNWRKRPFYLHLLLSLSGDVHFNPGPDFPCGLCDAFVFDEDKAMCCDGCDKWIHVSCDQYLTEVEYDYLVQNPSSDPWFCSACIVDHVSVSSQSHEFLSRGCKLRCLYFNSRSIYCKRFDLAAYLAACDCDFDIIAITESFLDSSISNSLIVPSSYVGHRLDRNRHGGGLFVLVKDSLSVTRRLDLESDCELLWLEIFTQTGPILLGTFYRPPNSDPSILNSLNHSLLSINTDYSIVLCGDFNLPHINWSTVTPSLSSPAAAALLCSLVNDNFLTQMVNFPTRHDSILDLVLVNHTNIISRVHPVDSLPGTDHEAIYFELSAVPPPRHNKRVLDICTIIIRLTLIYFVILCVMCLGTVFLVVMLRKHGQCGRICFSVLLTLLFLRCVEGDLR